MSLVPGSDCDLKYQEGGGTGGRECAVIGDPSGLQWADGAAAAVARWLQ